MKILLPAFLFVFLFACRKNDFNTSPDASVAFTADTLKFDTVFTSAGSVTQSFKIINENNEKLRISNVSISPGSLFQINVDGTPGPSVSNIDINANDSTYIFVSANVDPNAANVPFVIRDSIKLEYNGVTRFIQLEAWGQNAHFFRNKKITGTETWNNDLPYVILGSLIIDTNATLIINKGSRIHVHADAPLLINGTLIVNGEKDSADRVFFRGDRLDEPYRDFPASWPGLFFRASSVNSVLNYAVIANAYQGIALEDPSTNALPKLTLNECIVDNAYDAGIVAVNSSIRAKNTLISNCGKNVLLVKGGDYNFDHCTVVSNSNIFLLHKDPVLVVTNFISVNNVPVTAPLSATFTNSIFWGDQGIVENEVIVARSGTGPFQVSFNRGLIKAAVQPANSTFTQVIFNQSPVFEPITSLNELFKYRLATGSPAINAGIATGVTIDLQGNTRPVGAPDLGAYEKQ